MWKILLFQKESPKIARWISSAAKSIESEVQIDKKGELLIEMLLFITRMFSDLPKHANKFHDIILWLHMISITILLLYYAYTKVWCLTGH